MKKGYKKLWSWYNYILLYSWNEEDWNELMINNTSNKTYYTEALSFYES